MKVADESCKENGMDCVCVYFRDLFFPSYCHAPTKVSLGPARTKPFYALQAGHLWSFHVSGVARSHCAPEKQKVNQFFFVSGFRC
jgi:hypothetical protein